MTNFQDCSEFTIQGGTFNAVGGDYITNHNLNGLHLDRQNPLSILSNHAAFNAVHNSEQRYPPPNCHPGTRSQVLQLLSTWIQGTGLEGCRIFWIYGTVGVGKSAIAQTLCEKFAGSQLAASFFFSRTDPSRNNIERFVATLAHQHATSKQAFTRFTVGRTIKSAVKDDPHIFNRTMETTFGQLLLRPYEKVPRALRGIVARLIVIDGLDECLDIPSQERLLSLIWMIVNSHPNCPLDFLIFTRPEAHITDFFNRISMASAVVHCMSINDSFQIDRDIETYLHSRFREILVKHRRVLRDVPESWPGPVVISQLVRRACGQFVYATTVTKYIDTRYALPTKRLEDILSARPAQPSPYAELDLLYHQVLRSCDDITIVLQILQLVLGSSPDVATNQPWLIAKVLDLDKAMIMVSLTGLHSVLRVPESDTSEPIRIPHASFSEFLHDSKRSREFFVPPLPVNTRIEACFLSGFQSIRKVHHLPRSWPGKAALASLIQRACGQMEYVRTLVRYLSTDVPEERMNRVLRSEANTSSVTADLDLLYRQILHDSIDTTTVLLILQLLLADSEGLRINEPWLIAGALGLDEAILMKALNGLYPVLQGHTPEVDSLEPIQIRHMSFIDFLCDAERSHGLHVPPLPNDTKMKVLFLSKLQNLIRRRGLSRLHLRRPALASLAQRAGGQAKYAETVIRYLSADYPLESRLNMILYLKPDKPGQTELDLLYHYILQECGKTTVSRMLRLLVTGCRREMAERLELIETPVSDVLTRLHPVLEVVPKSRWVSMDATFVDFLFDAERSGAYHIAPIPSDRRIERCLRLNLMRYDPGHYTIPRLLQWARGQDIYVQVLIGYLERCPEPDNFYAILNKDPSTSSQSPHPELDILYQQILGFRINQRERNITLRILLLVIRYGDSPQEMEASPARIGKRLNISDSEIYHLLWRLNTVVLYLPSQLLEVLQPIIFLHPSFEEFLLDPERSGEFYVGEGSKTFDEVVRLDRSPEALARTTTGL